MDKKKKNWKVWDFQEVADAFVLDKLKNVKNTLSITRGKPQVDFAQDAYFTVDPDFPNNVKLIDCFWTIYRLTVVSPKVREVLQGFSAPNLEFLPVKILNHKGRLAGEYFILHSIGLVDALDIEKSQAKWDEDDPSTVDAFQRLVIREDAVDPSLCIFKLKQYQRNFVVRPDVAQALVEARCTGIRWIECEKFSRD